jgi:hypothetical protein
MNYYNVFSEEFQNSAPLSYLGEDAVKLKLKFYFLACLQVNIIINSRDGIEMTWQLREIVLHKLKTQTHGKFAYLKHLDLITTAKEMFITYVKQERTQLYSKRVGSLETTLTFAVCLIIFIASSARPIVARPRP